MFPHHRHREDDGSPKAHTFSITNPQRSRDRHERIQISTACRSSLVLISRDVLSRSTGELTQTRPVSLESASHPITTYTPLETDRLRQPTSTTGCRVLRPPAQWFPRQPRKTSRRS
ncbi:hypothetical protein GBAR_LOCUS5115 [Geodia barretti]|uniref:Uncharacterized protein n=1 Tax=Geodia barretti TaxID=519541 RepID=A0AA35RAA2_GEOBA|nr:hypothetical protein GBAR_LOCUS5115 [Geodia barretti]